MRKVPFSTKVSFAFILFLAIAALFSPLLPLPDPYQQDIMESNIPPFATIAHLLGTDELGRDMLSRVVFGSRFSLFIGLGSVAVGLLAGVPLGLLAGFFGAWIDALISRVIDVILAFPGIILALAVVAISGPGITNLIIAVGLRTLPVFARVARGQTLTVRQRDFVQAAFAIGCRPHKIMLNHILPNISGPLLVVTSLQIAVAVLIAATLSFLGVGLSPEVPEWGTMLSAGRQNMLSHPHQVLVPGITLMSAMITLNIIADYLRDLLDPRSQFIKI